VATFSKIDKPLYFPHYFYCNLVW